MIPETITLVRDEAAHLDEWIKAAPGAQGLLAGTLASAEYARLLIETYHYLRWQSALLRLAARRLSDRGDHGLARLISALAGWQRRQESRALADLRALGHPAEEALARPPSSTARAYVALNCSVARGQSPLALLGPAYVLEFLSAHHAGSLSERLAGRSRIPGIERALTMLAERAASSGRVVAEIERALQLVADPADREAVAHSALISRHVIMGLIAGTSAATSGRGHSLPLDWEVKLTPRQQEVTRLVLVGDDNDLIGRKLGCAEETVKKHFQHVLLKLRCLNRSDLFALYLQHR